MPFPISPANNLIALVNGIEYVWNAPKGAWYRYGDATANVITANTFQALNGVVFSDGIIQKSAGLANTSNLITVNGFSQLYLSNSSATSLNVAGGILASNIVTNTIRASDYGIVNANTISISPTNLGSNTNPTWPLKVTGNTLINGSTLVSGGQNLFVQSDNFSNIIFVTPETIATRPRTPSVAWQTYGLTILNNNYYDPFGGNNALLFIANTYSYPPQQVSYPRYIGQIVDFNNSSNIYTFSTYVQKMPGTEPWGTSIFLAFSSNNALTATNNDFYGGIEFDLSGPTGNIVRQMSSALGFPANNITSYEMVPANYDGAAYNNYYRCAISITANTSWTNGAFYLYATSGDGSVTGSTAALAYGIYGPQLEIGIVDDAFIPKNYTPTTTVPINKINNIYANNSSIFAGNVYSGGVLLTGGGGGSYTITGANYLDYGWVGGSWVSGPVAFDYGTL